MSKFYLRKMSNLYYFKPSVDKYKIEHYILQYYDQIFCGWPFTVKTFFWNNEIIIDGRHRFLALNYCNERVIMVEYSKNYILRLWASIIFPLCSKARKFIKDEPK